MLLFEKILVPLDSSEHSKNALEKAIQIAKKFDSEITLIHVCSLEGVPFSITATKYERYVQNIRNFGNAILDHGLKQVESEGVHAETRLLEGHTVEEIIKVAKERKFDLIVMGARGLSAIKEIFLGSVSHGVINHVQCPVLVVK